MTTQRGLIIKKPIAIDSTIIQQPLEGGDPLFVGQSFEHLEAEIPALMQAGSYGFGIASPTKEFTDGKSEK